VKPALPKGIVDHGRVAAAAKLEAPPLGGERLLRRGAHVALGALLVGHGLVGIGQQQASDVRAVRVVAGRAPGLTHGVAAVALDEVLRGGIVTLDAQRGQCLREE
jgi:hypothetical protein